MAPKSVAVVAPGAVVRRDAVLDLVEDWHAALELQVRAGEISKASRDTYAQGVDRFVDWCGRRRSLSEEVVLEWKADMLERCKPATVNTWLSGLRAFFDWAVRHRRLAYNLAAGVRGARRSGTSRKHKREALTDAEVLRALAQPDVATAEGKRDRALLALMAYTAARQVELHRADLADLRSESGRLVLHVRGKGHQEADELVVIAHPDAEAAVHDWLAARGQGPGPLFVSLSDRSRGGRLSLSAIRRLVKGYFKAAGVRGALKTAHSLRHSAITNAVRHGAPVQKVQSMARHANISTTMIYFHETDRIENPAEQFIQYNGGETPGR